MPKKGMKKLADPIREWAKEQAKKFKNSRPDCPMLQASLWFPDSGFPRPRINVMEIGKEGRCQCKNCTNMRGTVDNAIIKSLMGDFLQKKSSQPKHSLPTKRSKHGK